uniref:Very-long-chain (3R)-3-hydroxyacyl-CoA dehydratase n=1 Tax=Rhizophora mucronata TaxID=61149 RepID=A0A2P2KLJ7_RHIMU
MSALTKLYLFAYNSLQAIGWATAFLIISNNFISTKSLNEAYASAGELICLLQIIGFLEVIHGALGIVPTGVLLPFMQWGGRTHFVLAIVRKITEVQKLPSVFITFVAWSLAEVSFLVIIFIIQTVIVFSWPVCLWLRNATIALHFKME